jgi:chloramphenicol 3-O phosphotransferase
MTGTVIFINGTSSSGKTSLVRALQQRLGQLYVDLGIDRFIFAMPKRYLERPLWDDVLGGADRAGATGEALVTGMHHAIAAAARAGLNVIADHVLVERAWVDECAQVFSEMPAYLVGIRCPLEVLEERERSRKDRTLGQARAQFGVIHQYTLYDVEVNTAACSPEECAQQVIVRLASPPAAFQTLMKRQNPG